MLSLHGSMIAPKAPETTTKASASGPPKRQQIKARMGKAKTMPLARRRPKFGVTPISFWFAHDKALARTKAGSRATRVP
jgi:ribosomal protein L15